MPEYLSQLPELIPGLRILAGAVLGFWVLLALDRRRWWPSQWSLHLAAAARQPRPGELGDLVVVVPARNEAATIPRTLPRLLKQHDWFHRIVVVDDRSEDRTRAAADRLHQGFAGTEKLQVIRIERRQEGWGGKVWALQKGYEKAVEDWPGDPERQWVLFTDADILHPTTSISRMLSKAVDGQHDLVSVMATLRTDSFAARLLIPAYVYFFQLLYPFRKASDPRSRTAAAAGGCILVRRTLLEQIDGLTSLKDRVIDDLALARAAKVEGANCWLGLDPDISSIRVYGSMHDVVALVARTAFEKLGRHYVLVPLVWLALLLFYTGPLILAVSGAVLMDGWIAIPALLAWLLQSAHYLPVVQYLNVSSAFVAAFPLAAVLYGWMTGVSAWRHLSGQRIPWRENLEDDATI